MIIRNGKSQYSNRNKILSRTISSEINGNTVLDLQVNNNILTDSSGNVKQWNNNAKIYENIGFLTNDVDYESSGVNNIKIVNGGIRADNVANAFLYYEDINDVLYFNHTDTIQFTFGLSFNDISQWTLNNTEYLMSRRTLDNQSEANTLTYTCFLRKISATEFRFYFYVSGSIFIAKTIDFKNSDLQDTNFISVIVEDSYIVITFNHTIYSKSAIGVTNIKNTNKYVTLCGIGQGSQDDRCAVNFSLNRLVVRKDTFFDILNQSIGNTIDTGFHKRINL